MKSEQRKRLQASAKRRQKRQAAASVHAPPHSGSAHGPGAHNTAEPGEAPSAGNSPASGGTKTNRSVGAIAVVLAAADKAPNAVTNHVILRACRSFLKFKTPQDDAARSITQGFEALVKADPTIEREVRDVLTDLGEQASAHLANEDSDDHSLLAFLRTLNS